jgi:hypothetical protein
MQVRLSTILGLAVGSLVTVAAHAAPISSEIRPAAPAWRDSSVEIKPLGFVASAIPGIGTVGVGAERFIDNNTAGFIDLSYMTADLNKSVAQKNDDKYALPDRVNSYAVGVGARYYGVPATHTWYAGAKLGYDRSEGRWTYQGEELRKEVASLTPGVEGGYRWLFTNGVLIRAGAGVGGNVVVGEQTDSDASDKAVDAVNKATKPPVSGKLDLGLGYAF